MNKNKKIEDLLENDEKVLQMTAGFSMWPMLRHRQDPIIIEKITRPLKVNDVVLFKRDNGKYVLHRIIKIRSDDYVIRGDNCINNEAGITRTQILGILKGFYKGKRYIDCEKNLGYMIYIILAKFRYIIRVAMKKTLRFFVK